MKAHYTAVIKQSGQWWIGWIEEVPGVNCQEASKEELLESLRVTLREALEFNRREALEAAGDSFEEEPITTGGAPGRSSSGRKARPAIGARPIKGNAFADTNALFTRSGARSSSLTFDVPFVVAAMSVNVRAEARQSR